MKGEGGGGVNFVLNDLKKCLRSRGTEFQM